MTSILMTPISPIDRDHQRPTPPVSTPFAIACEELSTVQDCPDRRTEFDMEQRAKRTPGICRESRDKIARAKECGKNPQHIGDFEL